MKLHEAWIIKAENDLKTARKFFETDDPVLETSIYHAQQCAEKALKAYLALKGQPIQKTHDVAFLVELCSELDESIGLLMDNAALLAPYATAFRYPDILLEPDPEDVFEVIKAAEATLDFIKRIIDADQGL